jgi:hypothetical protein
LLQFCISNAQLIHEVEVMDLLLVIFVTKVTRQQQWQHYCRSGECEENPDEVCSNHNSSFAVENYQQSRGVWLKDCEQILFFVFQLCEHKQNCLMLDQPNRPSV